MAYGPLHLATAMTGVDITTAAQAQLAVDYDLKSAGRYAKKCASVSKFHKRNSPNSQPWTDVVSTTKYVSAETFFLAESTNANGATVGTMEVTYYVSFKGQRTN